MIGIYAIRNINTDRIYIGSSVNIEERHKQHLRDLRRGKHHNLKLQRSFNQSGEEAFNLEVVELCSANSLHNVEERYLDSCIHMDNFNISHCATGGDLLRYHPDKGNIRNRILKSHAITMSTLSTKEKCDRWSRPGKLNGMFGKTHTDEAKAKISKANKGNSYCVGKKASDKTRKKISDAAKQRTGDKNHFYGKHHSDETKQKIRAKAKGRLPPNTKRVSIDGTEYISASNAGRQLGIPNVTISYRCNSTNPKFSNYYYI